MILRKPFAILIKNFRLIHLFLSMLVGYLALKTYSLNSFFDTYVLHPITLVTPEEVASLCNIWLYMVPIFMIIGLIIIAALMKFKEKPILFYISSVFICIVSIIVYAYANSTLVSLEIALQDIRVLKLNQDFLRTILFLQIICFVVTLVRATGFNIKKFNFNEDLQELEIEERDNEEFEFNIEMDEGKLKRDFNKFKRTSKYVFAENKKFIITVLLLLVAGVIYLTYNHIYVSNKIYRMNETVESLEYFFTVNKSYTTKYDYNLKTKENMGYVVIEFNFASIYKEDQTLEPSLFALEINGHRFYHNKSLDDKFFDLGMVYDKSNFGSNGSNYIFIYEVPETFLEDKMHINYLEGDSKQLKIRITSESLDKKEEVNKLKLGEEIDFGKSVLGKTTLKITNFELASYFKNEYNFCLDNNCTKSYEYVLPSFRHNYKKVLLKLTGSYSEDETKQIRNLNDMKTFLTNFGVLKYKVGEETKTVSNLNLINPKKTNKKDDVYIEINEEIMNSSEIWLEFKVRNQKYEYKVK